MKRIHMKTFVLVVAMIVAVGCSRQAAEKAPAGNNESARIASTDVVEATPQEATIAAGESGELVVPIKIANGYHVNANPPSFSYLKATELVMPAANGISVEFITYPDPLVKRFSFSEKELAVYEGEAVIKARLKADKSAPAGKHNLSAQLRVQACDDKVCYAPGVIDLKVPVNIK
ncbi:MAG TPA: protein-disulfide reductase DsbD domain-containing protein [Pyrinomonadaceae bacterium]|nr:protein-disulfide reductase DsbD domain-containing protein [Pyrinomonadaceae bacterium]